MTGRRRTSRGTQGLPQGNICTVNQSSFDPQRMKHKDDLNEIKRELIIVSMI
jgi:hypothetical protein